MKFSITPLLILFSFLSFVACKENSSHVVTEALKVDTHTSQNSLDWNGSYSGNIKGLENENFSVILSLEVDGIYSIELNDGQEKIVKRNKFNWSADGQVIELFDVNEILNKFFVAENRLIQLNDKGQRPENENNYQLNKVEDEI